MERLTELFFIQEREKEPAVKLRRRREWNKLLLQDWLEIPLPLG
ncbi:hypothetical protein HCH_00698 [Hahella chejuensis KCTC 2396]|uniref:Uncharacterized protein n=1 Tax=Hahella chejuensis (strain KCTC 2396) TaxID=349521 RepID=Q2SP27_HAHCH|nr:hypothetical protein [Hahella chejuensis]ABC27597.1 hypothetical protein HCH_00698 [Hahella chejuensis KCTC 2396]